MKTEDIFHIVTLAIVSGGSLQHVSSLGEKTQLFPIFQLKKCENCNLQMSKIAVAMLTVTQGAGKIFNYQ